MKHGIKLSAAAVLLLFSAGAAAADTGGWYGSILGGASFDPALRVGGTRMRLDNGYNVGGRIGTSLGSMGLPDVSAEADVFYNDSHYTGVHAHLGSTSYMGNLIYHLPTSSPFGIYGGAGIGAVDTNYHLAGASNDSTVLGWQAIGGVEYAFSPETSLFGEYRYQNAHDINVGGIPVGNTSNNLSVGVKFHI